MAPKTRKTKARSLAPGVYVQEVASAGHAIAGVGTSLTAFVGPTLSGPTGSPPEVLSSYAEFEHLYGGLNDLSFAPHLNHIAHAARVYFAEGGMRLCVARVAGKPRKAAPAVSVAPKLADYKKAFALLAGLPNISIVAAPGHTAFPAALAAGVAGQLVAHAEQLLYRFAVLDPPPAQDVAGARSYRASFNSSYAALYYPWIVAANPGFDPMLPGSAGEVSLPPSGFVCGIYARCDVARGVSKAPANEVIRSALRFERALTTNDQDTLNPLGVNCLRAFPGKGNLVWGARTTSADAEWRYVNVRRYFAYLERSVCLGTQWAVFEPNGDALWARIRASVSNFLSNEWHNGALQGSKPEQAFYVRCDRSTMSQNDLDNGRLICEVGVAIVRPAEFVIFRIGQKTASAPT